MMYLRFAGASSRSHKRKKVERTNFTGGVREGSLQREGKCRGHADRKKGRLPRCLDGQGRGSPAQIGVSKKGDEGGGREEKLCIELSWLGNVLVKRYQRIKKGRQALRQEISVNRVT